MKSEEHKDIITKGRSYPDLEDKEKLAQSTIIKLKHSIEDFKQEYDEMKFMLKEKNSEISQLREERKIPFVTQSFLEGKGAIYYANTNSNDASRAIASSSWLDKLSDFIKKLSK